MDNLYYVIQKIVGEINQIACKSTLEPHLQPGGRIPIHRVVAKIEEESFGNLYYWFSKAVTMSALLVNQHPFDQPGVEEYKTRMIDNIKKK